MPYRGRVRDVLVIVAALSVVAAAAGAAGAATTHARRLGTHLRQVHGTSNSRSTHAQDDSPPTILSTCDEPSLLTAISSATGPSGDGTVQFNCTGQIMISSSIVISSGEDLTLDASEAPSPGVTLEGVYTEIPPGIEVTPRLFDVQGGTLSVIDIDMYGFDLAGTFGVAGTNGTGGSGTSGTDAPQGSVMYISAGSTVTIAGGYIDGYITGGPGGGGGNGAPSGDGGNGGNGGNAQGGDIYNAGTLTIGNTQMDGTALAGAGAGGGNGGAPPSETVARGAAAVPAEYLDMPKGAAFTTLEASRWTTQKHFQVPTMDGSTVAMRAMIREPQRQMGLVAPVVGPGELAKVGVRVVPLGVGQSTMQER